MLGKLRRLVIDVSHADSDGGGASARDVPLVNSHHHKLIQVVGPLIVQRASGEDCPMGGDGEVWTQGVIGQLCVLLRVTVTG